MNKYVLGIDFGTLSCRTILVDVQNGFEVRSSVVAYPQGVMDTTLHGVNLPRDFALQDANDYLYTLEKSVQLVLKESGIDPQNIIGLGIDFTSCTVLPVDQHRMPLSNYESFKKRPHAYVKLWKHHHAQPYATRIEDYAKRKGLAMIERYGNQVSSEWFFPKILEVLHEDEEVFNAAHTFIEAGDWVVSCLVGEDVRSSCQAGYKAFWHKQEGYPTSDFFAGIDSRLKTWVDEKLPRNIRSVGMTAGYLTDAYAHRLGLMKGTPVAVPYIDAHSAVPGLGITQPHQLCMILGTSTCHMVVSKEEIMVTGISGVVEDGILPGYYGYEAGQPCVGNALEWWIDHYTPKEYHEEAFQQGLSIYQLYELKASLLQPGENGLIALDWLNGNRSVLSNSDLTSLLIGLNLSTRPEDIYRALIESTAYGAKTIIDNFRKQGVAINRIVATGGITKKNALWMQIYADALGETIYVGRSDHAVALGSAIAASVAAGKPTGGYATIEEASIAMGGIDEKCYIPKDEHVVIYKKMYDIYQHLHDFFGKQHPEMMKDLKVLSQTNRKG